MLFFADRHLLESVYQCGTPILSMLSAVPLYSYKYCPCTTNGPQHKNLTWSPVAVAVAATAASCGVLFCVSVLDIVHRSARLLQNPSRARPQDVEKAILNPSAQANQPSTRKLDPRVRMRAGPLQSVWCQAKHRSVFVCVRRARARARACDDLFVSQP